MRTLLTAALILAACRPAKPAPAGSGPGAPPPQAPPVAPKEPQGERMAADTPRTTAAGHHFTAPAGWTVTARGQTTLVTPPEPGSAIALCDVQARDAAAAVKAAWAAYKPAASWPLKVVNKAPDREGWKDVHTFTYQTSPNERRDAIAEARSAGGETWLVILYDMAQAVGEKRGGQVAAIFDHLQPKGFQRESFAGKQAHKLDAARVAALGQYVKTAQERLRVPGVSLGLVQDGEVVFAGGFGVRVLGEKAAVDGDTLYMIASNTKAMTTLMLAKLVEEKKMTWETPARDLLPSFKLGSEDTTGRVLVKHLICACTGMPRQDMEWLFQFKDVTPAQALATLATMEPTSKFGELFQYSNPLAAAAGFIGGHVAYPDRELGAAYDEAMRTRVFAPLGMKATTFDYARAQRGNHARPHSPDIDGKTVVAPMELHYAVVPLRPAGAAWSSVRDVLRYVQMELDEGLLPDGKRYLERETLLARRAPQVAIGKDVTYGMGLEVDTTYGVPVVHHGGAMIGFHSDMIWLPEHRVGAVILTNGDPGWLIRGAFRRKLLEVLFDGKPEADDDAASGGKSFYEQLAAERKLLTLPADAAEAAKLAPRYRSDALGEIAVSKKGAATVFDMGEWRSEVASRKNPDGSVSFVTTQPGLLGFSFVVGAGPRRTLVLRDAQHEYTFVEM